MQGFLEFAAPVVRPARGERLEDRNRRSESMLLSALDRGTTVAPALARLSLDQKDTDGARDYAVQSLSLANQHGLELRKTHGLVVLGLAMLETGRTELGIAHLRLAKQMADSQGYWARSGEAESKLLELGVDPAQGRSLRPRQRGSSV